MTISQIKLNAKNSMKNNLFTLFIGIAVSNILSQLLNIIYNNIQIRCHSTRIAQIQKLWEDFIINNPNPSFNEVFQFLNKTGFIEITRNLIIGGCIVGIITFVISACFIYGSKVLVLNNIKTHKANFSDIFAGFPKFGKSLLIMLLQAIYLWLWSLLLIIPAVIKSYSYAMTYFIAIDNPDISSNEAITRSRQMMKGHKWQLFLLDLSFIGWWLLSALTCGILALIYVVPYTETARATFYRSLIGETDETDGETTQTPSDMSNVIEVSAEELNSKML